LIFKSYKNRKGALKMLEVKFYPGEGLEVNDLFQAYMTAKKYIYQSPRGKEIFDALEDNLNQKTVLHVDPTTDSTFQHQVASIKFDAYWNPIKLFKLKPKGIQSPALGLIHELGHALQCQTKLAWYEERSTGERYLEIEEDNVATNETPIAIHKNEPVRIQYRDFIGANWFTGRAFTGMSLQQKVIYSQK